MSGISRAPAEAARGSYDVAILGGGIYGAMLLLAAAVRGLAAVLIEKSDYGGATSFNSLRIIHGGLRYLQSLDIARSRVMIAERAWFLEHFPDLVAPLPCLMPTYGRGLRRASAMRLALWLDRLISKTIAPNAGQALPRSRVVSADEVPALFPMVDRAGLEGGAVWYDAHVPDSQRLVIETLRWAVSLGGTALNYVEAEDLMKNGRDVRGVVAHDKTSGDRFELRAGVVVNATGPSSRTLAARYDRDIESVFRPSLAWNILFDRSPLSDHALALSEPKRGAQVYFLVPWKGRMLAGTGHDRLTGRAAPNVTTRQLEEMIGGLNGAVPGLDLELGDVAHVFPGLLPARRTATNELATRAVTYDHGRHGGPEGLVTVSGVKLVAARRVAERVMRTVCGRFFASRRRRAAWSGRPPAAPGWDVPASRLADPEGFREASPALRRLVEEESVMHLDDLAFRRTTLWEQPAALARAAPDLCSLFRWDEETARRETERLRAALEPLQRRSCRPVPGPTTLVSPET